MVGFVSKSVLKIANESLPYEWNLGFKTAKYASNL